MGAAAYDPPTRRQNLVVALDRLLAGRRGSGRGGGYVGRGQGEGEGMEAAVAAQSAPMVAWMSNIPLPEAVDYLPTRTMRIWKVAHVLLDRDGLYTCMDIDLSAPSLEELKAAIVAAMRGMKRNKPMAPVSQETWARFVNAALIATDAIHDLQGFTNYGQLLVVVRQEAPAL